MSDARPLQLPRLAPALGLAALAALGAASAALARQRFPFWAQAALTAGLALWAVLAFAMEREGMSPLDPRGGGVRRHPLIGAIVLAGVAFWTMPPEEFRMIPAALWMGAIALWVQAWRARPREASRVGPWWSARSRTEWIALAAILGLGAFFCFWRLRSVPPNPVSDHAEEMLDILDLEHGRHAIFFLRNLGVGPFHFYWTYLLASLFRLPLHYLTVKIATSAFELCAVFFMYLAGREAGGPWLGLSAAALVAWGKWPFSLGRQGLEYTYAVLPTIVVVWALLRYLRRGDRASALAAGAGIGIGLCTYPSFRVVPLLVPLALAAALFDRRRHGERWRLAGGGLLTAATAAIVSLPLWTFVLRSPQRSYFWSRSLTRLTGAERAIPGKLLDVFAVNLWNMARAFHWRGSSTWTVMLENDPFLDIVTGGLLLAGAVMLVVRILRGSWRWSWLALALPLLTLPSTLSLAYPNENPSLNRAGPAIPVVFLIAALPLAWLGRSLAAQRGALRAAGLTALAAALTFSVEENARVYFVDFARSYDQMIDHSLQMAQVIRQAAARGIPHSHAYLLGMDFWVDGRNIAFQIDDPAWADTHLLAQGRVPAGLQRPVLFLYHPSDGSRMAKIARLYPGAGHIVPQTFPDRDFGVYIAR